MDLDRLAIRIRPRTPWEAVDLGFMMAKRWWWPLTQLWLTVSLPLFVALIFLPQEYIWWQTIIVWWLKPIFERILLDHLSQAVFGEQPTTKALLKNFSRLAFRQCISTLTWRRLSVSRSFDAPVVQLEGLKGKARTKRLNVLHRQGASQATSLTVFGASIETCLVIALMAVLFMFIPPETDFTLEGALAGDGHKAMEVLLNSLGYIAMTLVVPFYVAAGFALYLNRRIHLEAWDIEIAFKNIVRKRAPKVADPKLASKAGSMSAVFLFALLSVFSLPESTYGDSSKKMWQQEEAKAEITEIKEGDFFNERVVTKTRVPPWKDKKKKDDKPSADWNLGWMDSIQNFFKVMFAIGEWLLWAIVLGLCGFIVYRYRHWVMELVGSVDVSRKQAPPKTLFGLDVTEESLPEDVGSAAQALLGEGNVRAAVSLLYRASLSRIIQKGVMLLDGDTELRCLRKLKSACKNNIFEAKSETYFERLTAEWQSIAYAHKVPPDATVIDLCRSWENAWRLEVIHER